jgi:hypothetical protein
VEQDTSPPELEKEHEEPEQAWPFRHGLVAEPWCCLVAVGAREG